jgi:hypothetical protein
MRAHGTVGRFVPTAADPDDVSEHLRGACEHHPVKRIVLFGTVAVVLVAALAIVATLFTGLATCFGEGEPYDVGSQAETFCYSNSGLSTAYFIAEVVLPVVCMIAFTVWAVVRERSVLLRTGAAVSVTIILGMAAIPPSLNTECSQEQGARGDSCGY